VLINPQLEGESLQHLLEIANPRLIATSDEAAPRFEGLPRAGTYRDRLFNVSGLDPHISDDDLRSLQRETPSADNRTLCFLSTSGSTGLPKLVPYAGTRLVLSAMAGQNALGIGPRDVMYVCLPLYHANGLMLGVMGALVAGATVLLRSRFSASSFWPDCIAHKVTVFVYVGEVCRFLLRRTSHEASEGHCVRLCIGNGLGSDLWESFQATFRIARIIEFYGGTDASVLLVNLTNTRGSVGYLPEPVRASRKVALLRHDADAGDVVRTTQGRCIEVGPGEAGELVSGVLTESDVKIYQNRRDSEARLLRDVFEPGDCFMRSGDLLSRDAAGFYYFVDRLGDTFRWRGENVSTTEIGALIAAATGVEEACVYGVRVPHEDGRAGMCALVCNASWDPLQFRREIARQAPRFALPMFLRVMRSIPKTTTYKYRRNELARQGFDPSQIRDQLFVMADGEYVPLQSDLFARLGAGEFKW
jgi:fatty-acyl-CoA synthase